MMDSAGRTRISRQGTTPSRKSSHAPPRPDSAAGRTCGRPLTGSWSKGRNGHDAYYRCQRQCRAVNVSKAELEGAFADELALLQPTAGYMRLVKDRILRVWEIAALPH
jgi:hypothetical protein